MPRGLIVGLPYEYQNRVNKFLEGKDNVWPEDWTVSFLPSRSRNRVVLTATRVLEALDEQENEGAHVYAFRPYRADGASIREALLPYFRFLWLPGQWLGYFPEQVSMVVDQITSWLTVESEWASRVKPENHRSPLFLPETSFHAARRLQSLWNAARQRAEGGGITGAARLIQEFREYHFRSADGRRLWVDEQELAFDHTGPRHGQTAYPRNWKYSARIPDGFHYDVKSRTRRSFSVSDPSGKSHEAPSGGHVNVDPHGHVRIP